MAQSLRPCEDSFKMEHLIRYLTTEIRKISREKVVLHLKIDEFNSHWAHGKESLYFAREKSVEGKQICVRKRSHRIVNETKESLKSGRGKIANGLRNWGKSCIKGLIRRQNRTKRDRN
jgi:hypothetical protein